MLPPSRLSPAARVLIDRVAAEDEPPEHEIEESWGMVASRVEGERTPPRSRAFPVRAAVIALVAAVLVGLGLWRVVAPPRERASVVRIPDLAPLRADAQPEAVVHPVARTPGADEGAGLLDEAEAALTADPSRAWTLLVRHAEVSSDTASVPRRLALRIRTLCALGRTDDAVHETTAFLAKHGDTPHAEEVRAACGARGAER